MCKKFIRNILMLLELTEYLKNYRKPAKCISKKYFYTTKKAKKEDYNLRIILEQLFRTFIIGLMNISMINFDPFPSPSDSAQLWPP